MTTQTHILRLDASANPGDSISRELGDRLIESLGAGYTDTRLVQRDLTQGIPAIDSQWIGANFTAFEEREDDQHEISFNLDRTFARKYNVSLAGSYSRNFSNIDYFDISRFIIGTYVRYAF